MNYEYINNSIEKEHIVLPNSDKINPFLLRNNYADLIKAVDFISSEEKFLYVHGFMGTGKRQFVNYICEFLSKDVIKLEYYCKEATVCDDILLSFIDIIDNLSISKAVNLNAKITTLNVKFEQQISSIKKPFLIILHSLDDILEENIKNITNCFSKITKLDNVKIIVTTRSLNPSVLGDLDEDRKISLKGFTKEIFKEFLGDSGISITDRAVEDFYELSRGCYYYAALSVKIIQAMNISLAEFLQKHKQSGMNFDSYLGITYINIIPTTIRNFFWFLRTIRHGISLNALALFELYDEFSLKYLKSNLMIFQSGDDIYVQDYFLQEIDISIPEKVQIKLHKFIIGIYEKQLKASLKERCVNLSRQALRAEIEYHNSCITNIKNQKEGKPQDKPKELIIQKKEEETKKEVSVSERLSEIQKLISDKKYTDAIEKLHAILESENLDLTTLVEIRSNLAKLYKKTGEYKKATHYYELLETYYIQHKEFINLNYLYYDMTDLYFKVYKNTRAIETIKKVIYSVDTPQSLMVASCTLLGNIYSEINEPQEAFLYYQKALQSLDENVEEDDLTELYFKYALANDDRGNIKEAIEYYIKCISQNGENNFRALAYSNMASCYFENNNYNDAQSCYEKAYKIEKTNNNYEGIYYTASRLAQLFIKNNSKEALDYLIEAQKSADFINEAIYMLESSLALGDYYYSCADTFQMALKEYFKCKKIVTDSNLTVDITLIERRINDMKLRLSKEDFEEIENKYGKSN